MLTWDIDLGHRSPRASESLQVCTQVTVLCGLGSIPIMPVVAWSRSETQLSLLAAVQVPCAFLQLAIMVTGTDGMLTGMIASVRTGMMQGSCPGAASGWWPLSVT